MTKYDFEPRRSTSYVIRTTSLVLRGSADRRDHGETPTSCPTAAKRGDAAPQRRRGVSLPQGGILQTDTEPPCLVAGAPPRPPVLRPRGQDKNTNREVRPPIRACSEYWLRVLGTTPVLLVARSWQLAASSPHPAHIRRSPGSFYCDGETSKSNGRWVGPREGPTRRYGTVIAPE